jgi:O-antigen/teichoic acid export membrane protein
VRNGVGVFASLPYEVGNTTLPTSTSEGLALSRQAQFPTSNRLAGAERGIFLGTLGNLASPVAGFLSAPILAQSLGVDGRGAVGASTAPLLLAMSMFTLGLPEAMTYYVARNQVSTRRAALRGAAILSATGIAVTIGIVCGAHLLAGGREDLQQLIAVASAALTPALVGLGLRGLAAGHGLWGLIAVEKLTGSVFRLAVVGGLALCERLDVLTATIAIAATTCVGHVAYVAMPSLLRNRRNGVNTASATNEASLLGFGLPMWLGSIAGILLSRLDQTLMTPLSSTYEMGLYVVAVTVGEVVQVFNGAVRDVVFSVEAEKPSEDRLGLASRVSNIFTLTAALLVGAVSVWALPWLFGADFAPAIPVLAVLLLAAVCGNPGSVAGVGLSARGRPGLRSWSLVAAFVVNVALTLLLVPVWGAMGAACATVLGSFIAGNLNILWLRIFFGMRASSFFTVRFSDFIYVAAVVRSKLGSPSP